MVLRPPKALGLDGLGIADERAEAVRVREWLRLVRRVPVGVLVDDKLERPVGGILLRIHTSEFLRRNK